MSYAELLYVHEIVNHTHSILGSITLIQVIQPVAREAVTAEAVPGLTSPHLLTVLDSACGAGFWLGAVVVPATGAGILISDVCVTEPTVHSAGGNQRCRNRVCRCRLHLFLPCVGEESLRKNQRYCDFHSHLLCNASDGCCVFAPTMTPISGFRM